MITFKIVPKPGTTLELQKKVSGYVHNVTGSISPSLDKMKKYCDHLSQSLVRYKELGSVLSRSEVKKLFGSSFANNCDKLTDSNIENNWTEIIDHEYKISNSEFSGPDTFTDLYSLLDEYEHYLNIEPIIDKI